jgi:hypothetical protein
MKGSEDLLADCSRSHGSSAFGAFELGAADVGSAINREIPPRDVRPYSARLAGSHVDEAAVVALERDRHDGGRAVPVLGHDQVRLPGPG